MLLSPAVLQSLSYQQPDSFSLLSPTFNFDPPKRSLYGRAFDHFAGAQDPNSPYALEDADKRKLFKQGLLQFAAAVSRPNGGNFANALASGLLSARGGMDEGAQQHVNDAYRADVMQRTRDEMAANTAKTTAYSHLYNPDGTLSQQGVAEVQKADPQGYLSIHDKLYPEQVNHWQPKEINFNGAAGTVLWNEKTGEMKTLDGQPFGTQPASTLGMPDLAAAVQQVESGGNPFAVSPKGAVGLMQTMPGTLADPGYGVAPARDNSPQEQARVGRDYLGALTQKYGTTGGLAAYNWGPGNWDKALAAAGGDPAKALALAPAETQAYVPKVLARAGGVNSAIPTQTASGTIPAALPFGFAQKKPDKLSPVDQRRQDLADLEAQGIKITPAIRTQYLMTGKMPAEDGGAMPSDPTAGLDPATAALVKKIATYDALPASLGRAGNRADLIGRAAMLNPGYNEATAQEAYTFKKDLGRSTPTSAGGQVTSINTALHHLGTMLQANKALNASGANSAYPLVNRAHNAMAHGTGSAAVNNWNQAKTFLSEEFAKLIKGGVATESEIQGIQSNLDASLSPDQRNQAIAQAAQFLQGRIDAIEQHRNDVLGDMAGQDKPLMTSESRRILDATLKLKGGNSGNRVLRYNPATGRIE